MSSTRTLSGTIAWDKESRTIELLDWETKPEDFDQLYEYVIKQLLTRRSGTSRERLFKVISEADLRREVRNLGEQFQERFISLPLYICVGLNSTVLPRYARKAKGKK